MMLPIMAAVHLTSEVRHCLQLIGGPFENKSLDCFCLSFLHCDIPHQYIVENSGIMRCLPLVVG